MKEQVPTNHSVIKFIIATLLGLFVGVVSGWVAYITTTSNEINIVTLIVNLFAILVLFGWIALLVNGAEIVFNFIYGEKTHKKGRIDTYFGLLGLLASIATYFILSLI